MGWKKGARVIVAYLPGEPAGNVLEVRDTELLVAVKDGPTIPVPLEHAYKPGDKLPSPPDPGLPPGEAADPGDIDLTAVPDRPKRTARSKPRR